MCALLGVVRHTLVPYRKLNQRIVEVVEAIEVSVQMAKPDMMSRVRAKVVR